MTAALDIVPLRDLRVEMEDLRIESVAEGFRFVDKLVAEWCSGANRFNGTGEILLGAFRAGDLIAIGGLNRDPYTDQVGLGRIRHLYVARSARRSAAGSALVRRLLEHAQGIFHSVRLRTETPEAAAFYVSLGFRPVQDEGATHFKALPAL